MLAAWAGQTEIISRLLAAKADLNVQDNEGWTALMFAAHGNKTEAALTLLQARAKIRLRNAGQQTAADIAGAQGAMQIVQAIKATR